MISYIARGTLTEKAIQKEMDSLRHATGYQRPPHLPIDRYEVLLRKIAICKLNMLDVVAKGILYGATLLAIFGFLYFKSQSINVSMFVFAVLVLGGILGGIYSYCHFKLKKHKQHLYL